MTILDPHAAACILPKPHYKKVDTHVCSCTQNANVVIMFSINHVISHSLYSIPMWEQTV